MDITPSQTIGPFFSHALPYKDGPYAVPPGTPDGVWLRGRIFDGAGEPVPDALVETWHAQRRAFGRCPTEADGSWAVFTPPPPDDGYLLVSVFARGLLDRLVTRVYLTRPDLAGMDATTLVAHPDGDGVRFDIRLQGEHETVFFDVRT